MTRSDILHEAEKCVCTDRDQQYGSPQENFSRIADLWNTYLGCIHLTAQDVAVMMALLKIGRMASGQVNADNFVDCAGYIVCAGEIATGEADV